MFTPKFVDAVPVRDATPVPDHALLIPLPVGGTIHSVFTSHT